MTTYCTGIRPRADWRVKNEIRMKFPSLSVNEGMARATVAAFCVQADPSATELADIKCAVSEAVTNCIVHAYRDTVGEIQMKIQIFAEGAVRVEIKDHGCGIEDIRRAKEPLYTTDAEGERSGMGFTVMENFCDGLRIVSRPGKGTSVTLTKRLRQRSRYT
jgi:stage II sporulation protein AB (anti-sigma F factor)